MRAQLYRNWELRVANDASPSRRVAAILKAAVRGRRVKWTRRQDIAAANNSALELASGEFVAFMDHDDVIPPHALYEVVAELNTHPQADIVYSDEDKIDDCGRRYDPYFKTDWNPELFLGHNFINHLAVYRRSLVSAAGGFRVGFEGGQDYDLALRCIRQTSADRIRHIRHPLSRASGPRTDSALPSPAGASHIRGAQGEERLPRCDRTGGPRRCPSKDFVMGAGRRPDPRILRRSSRCSFQRATALICSDRASMG